MARNPLTLWLVRSVVIFTFGLSSCSHPPRSGIRFALATAPVTLDPRFATDAAGERISHLLYRHLVDFDSHWQAIPDLAHWEHLSPTRWRFVLGDSGRTFHDGTRLTATDVQATYQSLLDPATASPYRTALIGIQQIIVVDEDRVDFLLQTPDPQFPGRLTQGILPARLLTTNHSLATTPLGSGPFTFLARPEEGRLQLRRIADGETVEFIEVKDPTVRVLKLLRGEIDILQGDLPPELVTYLEKQPELRVQRTQGTTFAYLGFNLADPVTADEGVRQAVAAAIDGPAIIRYLLAGSARPAASLLPPEHWAGHPSLAGPTYDPARAKKLLAAAGYATPGDENGKPPLSLVYKTSNDPLRVRIATVIQHQLAQVGIQVDLRSYDWGTFYGDIKTGRFQIYSLSWVAIKTPGIFRYVFHSNAFPPAGANRGHYQNPQIDNLIDQAEIQSDPADQVRLYQALQAQLATDLPYVPLWYEDQIAAMGRNVMGYQVSGDGNYRALAATTVPFGRRANY